MDWTDIEQKLIAQAEEVCRHLFPQGKREGGEFVVGSLDGEQGRSLKINLAGKIGVWRDFAGDKGGKSLCGLWAHARGLQFGKALGEAKRFLNIADDFDRRFQAAPTARGDARPTGPTAEDSSWRAVAEIWAKCQPLTEGGPVWEYLIEKRKLDHNALLAFDVREMPSGGGKWTMVFPYYACPAAEVAVVKLDGAPKPEWLKFEALERKDGKKREWTSKAPEKSLFGMQLARHPLFKDCRHVLICEGEKDALTWASYGCHAWGVVPLSVPFGAKWKGQDKNRPSPNREWLDRTWDWLQDFETVFVQMDGDEAGQRAAVDVITEIGPRRCRLVTLPKREHRTSNIEHPTSNEGNFKDANECLIAGVAPEAMKACLDTARDFAPDKIISAAELEAEFLHWVFERDEDEGLQLPFEFPLRFRQGETTLWLGIEKSGKTTLLNFATVAAIAQGERALVISFEVPWPNSHDKLCRQALGGHYYDKRKLKQCETAEEETAIKEASRQQTTEVHRWLAPHLWYYRHVGIGNWRQLMDDIRWARRRLGVTWVQIDNFMRLGIAKDDYAQQADAIISLVSLGMEMGIHLHIVLHKNKEDGKKGPGGKRTASGAHELLGNPHNIVEVQRDDEKGKQVSELFERKKIGEVDDVKFRIEKEQLDSKPDGKFLLHASRNGDTQDGSKYLWFLWESQQYADVPPGHKNHSAIQFTRMAVRPAAAGDQ